MPKTAILALTKIAFLKLSAFEINRLNLTSGIAVTDQEALIAMNTAFKHLKIVLEPGGAVALAAAIFKKIDVTNTKIDKLRNLFQKQPQNTTEYEFDNEIQHITDDYYFEEDTAVPAQNVLEKPYIYDENQIGFYFFQTTSV